MPDSNQSPSDPDFLKDVGRSARNVGLGIYRTGSRIVQTDKSPTYAAGIAGVVTGLTLLFPLPFAILGAMSVIDSALNGSEQEDKLAQIIEQLESQKKATDAPAAPVPPGAPAAAAG